MYIENMNIYVHAERHIYRYIYVYVCIKKNFLIHRHMI